MPLKSLGKDRSEYEEDKDISAEPRRQKYQHHVGGGSGKTKAHKSHSQKHEAKRERKKRREAELQAKAKGEINQSSKALEDAVSSLTL